MPLEKIESSSSKGSNSGSSSGVGVGSSSSNSSSRVIVFVLVSHAGKHISHSTYAGDVLEVDDVFWNYNFMIEDEPFTLFASTFTLATITRFLYTSATTTNH